MDNQIDSDKWLKFYREASQALDEILSQLIVELRATELSNAQRLAIDAAEAQLRASRQALYAELYSQQRPTNLGEKTK